jgi:hypothetical protein
VAKSLEDVFTQFIGNLQPLQTEHAKAEKHKDSVYSCLKNNWGCIRLFVTGSFGNGTSVKHHSDTDYFAICPGENLNDHSGNLLRAFKEALQATFPRTQPIEVKTPAVRIPFGTHATEVLEITPACYKELVPTPLGKRRMYFIPDYDKGWMPSSPDAHNAYVQQQDKKFKGRLKQLIQLVKAWKFYADAPITSFYLELRVTKYSERCLDIVFDRDVRNILKLLYDNGLASIQDPMKISGLVDACKSLPQKEEAFSKLKTAFARADKAYQLRNVNMEKSFEWWQKVYNGWFPSR